MKITVMEPLGIGESTLRQLAAGYELETWPQRAASEEELVQRLATAEVVILANQKLPRTVLERCPRLRLLSVAFTGVDHIDISYCRQRGITVCNAAGYSTHAVAELAIGLMLACLRQLPQAEQALRKLGDKSGLCGGQLYGKTLGLIGTGAIGCQVAALGRAFGCRVIAWSRSTRPAALALGVEYLPLEQVLAQGDIVSLHVPATAETRCLLNRERLALMKPTAILINTARGPVVDSAALAQALNEGRLAAAGLDVFDGEPPLSPEEPLLSAAHTVLTPHIGYATQEALEQRAAIVLENVRRWQEGQPQNVIG